MKYTKRIPQICHSITPQMSQLHPIYATRNPITVTAGPTFVTQTNATHCYINRNIYIKLNKY